ncbi:hypothetical protein OBBRIDRAFT_138847 [Obba rivulosa]|uniref:F-box domain-containing protein n=1 Tax=Obba rivulosa TaxID=1052685 RepID=A0A8E2AMX4_9APHY|nr:hypothetical protein OBBRIDRAFT_138847 [Obba rivulosa]
MAPMCQRMEGKGKTIRTARCSNMRLPMVISLSIGKSQFPRRAMVRHILLTAEPKIDVTEVRPRPPQIPGTPITKVPVEIWCAILEAVDDMSDLLALSSTCIILATRFHIMG